MHSIRKLLLLCACTFLLFPAYASAELHTTKVTTTTLLVQKYSALEGKLQDALLLGDTNTINNLLYQTFEERRGYNPNDPIPRSDWIDANIKKSNSRVMRQMAARDLVNIIIVSYLLLKPDNTENIFVVDVWTNNGAKSQLITRYSSTDKPKRT
jgi:hypothetical protein